MSPQVSATIVFKQRN